MKSLLRSVPKAFLWVLLLTLNCPAQSANPKPKPKQAIPVNEELRQCRTLLKLLKQVGDGPSFTAYALNTEGLITTHMEVGSCIDGQGAALSKAELLTAYMVLRNVNAEEMKLLGNSITDAGKANTAKDAVLKTAGEIIANESNQYNALVARYNALVGEYNSLLANYRSYAADEYNFLTRIGAYLNSINSSYTWSPPSAPQVIYEAPTRTQIRCTTQTMPPPIEGLSSWSYTNCY